MISVEIEKEINHENKVILGCTMRQLFCCAIALVSAFLVALILGFNINLAMYPIMIIAAICVSFGWWKPNGEPLEKELFKRLQTFFYGSNHRKYRTKNQYVTMMNAEYNRRRNIDQNNKQLMKQVKKETKKKKEKTQYQPLV